MSKKSFGKLNGKDVFCYTITNGKITAEILDYGATLRSLQVPDKNGKLVDVVLGYNSLDEYVNDKGYFGATVGRVANRIKNGKFSLNGKEYNVGRNEGENSLHGGIKGFDRAIWSVVESENSLTFEHLSVDGDEGYPGNLKVKVTYTITDNNALKLDYEAVCDADTILNLTNHSYFNLNGDGGEQILNTQMQIDADYFLPTDEQLIPLGKLESVKGTPYDFTTFKKVGESFSKDFPLYDICLALNGKGYRKIAEIKTDVTGIAMETYTDLHGYQVYTPYYPDAKQGKNGLYGDYCAICVETQYFPNAINCKNFPSPVLKKGDVFKSTTEYVFKNV